MHDLLLRARDGLAVSISTYGARITAMHLADGGPSGSIVYGFADREEYERDERYHGATIGRFANRIAGGAFSLDGRTYRLSQNEGRNTLHGGRRGFDRAVWRVAQHRFVDGESEVTLEHESPDGDQGFPGNVIARVCFAAGPENVLHVDYTATTSAPTPLTLTNHSYFNLTGSGTDVYGHRLRINAAAYLPLDDELLPTGAIAPVHGTAYDLRALRPLPAVDNYWVLDDGAADALELFDPSSRRTMRVTTTEPGVQIYSGFAPAVAIETQGFPDAPNRPDFPSTIVRPSQPYRSRTTYRFEPA